jgi:hypothetical protein
MKRLANAWLERGLYSDALMKLAYLDTPVLADARPLFEQSIARFGMALPSPRNAASRLFRHQAAQVLEGDFLVMEGIGRFVREVYFPSEKVGTWGDPDFAFQDLLSILLLFWESEDLRYCEPDPSHPTYVNKRISEI